MKTAVIQMGHCFRTRGATGTAGEQPYVVKVADACNRLLKRDGWTVRVILADEDAARYRGDAFFALHCDGSTNGSARGASTGYITPEGQALARAFKLAYERRGWTGFRPDNYSEGLRYYYGTRTAVNVGNRGAVIIECGFLTNAEDRAALNAEGGPERVALAIGDALGIRQAQPPALPVEDEVSGYSYVAITTTGSRKGIPYVISGTGTDLTARQMKANEEAAARLAKISMVELPEAMMNGLLNEALAAPEAR